MGRHAQPYQDMWAYGPLGATYSPEHPAQALAIARARARLLAGWAAWCRAARRRVGRAVS
jgi:hypothetical protein